MTDPNFYQNQGPKTKVQIGDGGREALEKMGKRHDDERRTARKENYGPLEWIAYAFGFVYGKLFSRRS